MMKIAFSLMFLLGFQIMSAQGGLMQETVIGVDEKLGETLPGDIRLIDESGDTVYWITSLTNLLLLHLSITAVRAYAVP
jgi:hypothetical protein